MTNNNATSPWDSDQTSSKRRHEPLVDLTSVTLPSVFESAQFILDGNCCQHVPFYFWIVEAARPRSILNIGQRSGEAYFAFCQMIEQLAIDSKCSWIIEPQHENEKGSGFEKTVANWKSISASNFASFAQISVGKLSTKLSKFSEESFDVIHIDVNSLVGCSSTLVSQLVKLLSHRGILLLQGSSQIARYPAFQEIITSMSKKHPCFEFPHGAGLLVIGVGDSPPTLLGWLFELNSELVSQSAVQTMFHRLGESHRSLFLLEELDEQATVLKALHEEIEWIRARILENLPQSDDCPKST